VVFLLEPVSEAQKDHKRILLVVISSEVLEEVVVVPVVITPVRTDYSSRKFTGIDEQFAYL